MEDDSFVVEWEGFGIIYVYDRPYNHHGRRLLGTIEIDRDGYVSLETYRDLKGKITGLLNEDCALRWLRKMLAAKGASR